MKVLVNIVSAQIMANVLPTLVLSPDKVINISSEKMLALSDRFEQTISTSEKFQNGHTAIVVEKHLPDSSLAVISDYALELKAKLEQQYPDAEFTYNATGGTKLMALAFAEVFRDSDSRIIYLDTEHQQIETLYPAGIPPHPLGPKQVSLTTHFKAHRLTLRKAQTDDDNWQLKARERGSVTRYLAENSKTLSGFYKTLNAISANAAGGNKKQQLSYMPNKSVQKALELLDRYQLIDWDKADAQTVYFVNEPAITYCNGGWLEEYAWLVANDIGFDEIRCGCEVTADYDKKADTRNELDLVIYHNYRILVIECKTSQFAEDSQKTEEIIYKLDSLTTHAGGLFGTPILLSARPLDYFSKNRDKTIQVQQRARAHDITPVAGEQVKQLNQLLAHWKATGELPSNL